jgi:GNAT superfamily N-acetyltransferase
MLVAERGGSVIGMGQLIFFRHLQHRGGLCAELESLHVAERFRGQGIGTQLLARASEIASERGAYRLQLTSNLERTQAHRFYLREGFLGSHLGFKRSLPFT